MSAAPRIAARRTLWQSPLVAVLGCAAAAAVGASITLIPLLTLALITPELVRVDVREHRLPNRLVVPALAMGFAQLIVRMLLTGVIPFEPLVAGGAALGLLLVLNLVGGMGMGDVKLGAALGLASWTAFVALAWLTLAFLLGGFASACVLIARARARAMSGPEEAGAPARIAFGPFLLAGFWLSVATVAVLRLSGQRL
jgi:leader peptidase (prepilin peptidase)/N-methyltransferase